MLVQSSCSLNVPALSMPLFLRCLRYFDVFVLSKFLVFRGPYFSEALVLYMSLCFRYLCSFNVLIPSMPLFLRCPCSSDAPVSPMPLFFRCLCSFNALVFSMFSFFQCPRSFDGPALPMPLSCQFTIRPIFCCFDFCFFFSIFTEISISASTLFQNACSFDFWKILLSFENLFQYQINVT